MGIESADSRIVLTGKDAEAFLRQVEQGPTKEQARLIAAAIERGRGMAAEIAATGKVDLSRERRLALRKGKPLPAEAYPDVPREVLRSGARNKRRDRVKELEAALAAIIERSHNDPLGTSKVIDMRRIAEDALARKGG